MDPVHKQRIDSLIETLVNATHYKALIRSIERADKNNVVSDTLLRKWQERPGHGWSTKQLNRELYSEIQRRGPDAFQLLIESLKDCGHNDLVSILDPSLSAGQDVDEEEITDANMEHYSDEGKHIVHLDSEWTGDECSSDRGALQSLFEGQGYQQSALDNLEGVGSLVVVNFCLENSNGVRRENDWIYKTFNRNELDQKPKILISLRYKGIQGQEEVEQDSGPIRKLFRDILEVIINLDSSKRVSSSEVSEEVNLLVQVFSAKDSLHFVDKIHQLQKEFEKYGKNPLRKLDSGFSKIFHLQKLN